MAITETSEYRIPRRQMVERQLKGRGIKNPRILEVMARVPRHLFVQEALIHQAYSDRPLPIGEGQTISQPFIVAQMSEALDLVGSEHVLEIGTGSGYQTAVLAELGRRIYTVERIRSLQANARQVLNALRYHNILFRISDGTMGWEEQGPFEAIIVTAGGPEIPEPLIRQLAPGGRMIVPVGQKRDAQTLIKITKSETGRLHRTSLGQCRFVDLVGEHGWRNHDPAG